MIRPAVGARLTTPTDRRNPARYPALTGVIDGTAKAARARLGLVTRSTSGVSARPSSRLELARIRDTVREVAAELEQLAGLLDDAVAAPTDLEVVDAAIRTALRRR